MEPILFYGVPHGCSFGSIVALEWLGQPYRLCRIDMLSETDGAIFKRVNPYRKTPTLLLEDSEVLTESNAILNHIAARDLSHRLTFPQGTREFDRVNRALGSLNSGLFGSFAPAWAAYKMTDEAAKATLRALAQKQVGDDLAKLDKLLAAQDWLAGDGRTIADAYFAGIARWAEDLEMFDLKAEYPNVHRHMQKLGADPAVIFAHAIEDGQPAVTSGGFLGHVTLEEISGRLAA